MPISENIPGITRNQIKQPNRYEPTKQNDPAVDQYMKELKEKFPELNFHVVSTDDKKQMKDSIQSQCGLYNVNIDPKILEQMTTDEAVRAKIEELLKNVKSQHDYYAKLAELSGKKVLAMGTNIDENGNASIYSATVKGEEKNPYIPTANSQDRYEPSKKDSFNDRYSYKYNYGNGMMRLAQARSITSVKGFIASQYAEISKVKALVSDETEAAITVRKIKKAIEKGRTKVTRLRKEENLQKQRRIAIKKKKAALSKELTEKLRKKRMARMGQEHCDTIDMGGMLENEYDKIRYKYGTLQYENTMSAAAIDTAGSIAAGGISAGIPDGISVGAAISSGADVSIDIIA